ncbi:cation diffusion facilitator family transporter [Marinilabiliaceae bacterium ANBcel2]|nr:cation diffusion facilitator family transporter [Marinilabiliaceae bacterium ANBcel2]
MKKNSPIYITWLSVFFNIFLFIIKLWAGLISGSVALLADAWHTLSDSVSSLAVFIGIKVAKKPADKNHPYGHGRAEVIASLVVGILLAVVGFNFLVESIVRLRSHEVAYYGNIAIIVTIISIVVKEIMARYSIYVGKFFNYNSLVADGWHHRIDSISSIIILLGIFLGNYFWWIDGVLGILISLFIFYTTWYIMRDSLSVLIGKGIDKSLKEKVKGYGKLVIEDIDLKPHHFKIHHYGNHTELSFHIVLPGNYSLYKAHDIAKMYEDMVEEELGMVVTIHVDAE